MHYRSGNMITQIKGAIRLGLFDDHQNNPLVLIHNPKRLCQFDMIFAKDWDQGKPKVIKIEVPGPERIVEKVI